MFSEDEYYRGFKKIRNKCRKFNYCSLIEKLFQYLHAPVQSNPDYLQKCPWLVLLLIKWLLLDSNYPNRTEKIPSDNDMDVILKSLYDLMNRTRMPDDYDNNTLFFRSFAYQQFFYQLEFGYRHLARQSLIFSNLPDNHQFKVNFKILTGVEIQEFIELSWILIFKFIGNNNTRLKSDWYKNFFHIYSPSIVDNFLDVISVQIKEARKVFLEEDDGKRKSTEVYELTPFIKFPLLQKDNEYHVVEKHILYRCIEYCIYDRLRQWDAQRFMNKFGVLFENYIKSSIKKSGVRFSTEIELRRVLGEHGNQIDFIVHEKYSNIFIDAKGVELNFPARITHSATFLEDKTKTSIIKSIKQAHDVIRKLEQTQQSKIPSQNINYLFVVTYKEFHIGSGLNYYELIAKSKMDEIYHEYSGCSVIPPDKMFFITVDELDYVCAMIAKGNISISGIFEIIKLADERPEDRGFEFFQYLSNMPEALEPPNFLVQEKDRITMKIRNYLKE